MCHSHRNMPWSPNNHTPHVLQNFSWGENGSKNDNEPGYEDFHPEGRSFENRVSALMWGLHRASSMQISRFKHYRVRQAYRRFSEKI